MEDQETYKQARKRAEVKFGFYAHLLIYIVASILFYFLNLLTKPEVKWFYWPIAGWGIGVIFHGISVFTTSSSIVERMALKELEKEKRKEEKQKD